MPRKWSIALTTPFAPSLALAGLIPSTRGLFDGDAVYEFHLMFHQADRWDPLVANCEGLEDPLYLEAEFD